MLAPAASAELAPQARDAGGATPPATFRVVIVPSINAPDLRALARRGALGLLVPGVGATIDRRTAIASLLHGASFSPYLALRPTGKAIISVRQQNGLPLTTNVIVLALPRNTTLQSNDERYPMAIIGNGCRGLLFSRTTRIAGLVAMPDIAPTALGRLRSGLQCRPTAHALDRIRVLDIQIHANNRLKMPTLIIVACLVLLLAVFRPPMTLPAILAALVANLVAGATHITSEPVLVALMVAGTLVGGAIGARIARDDRDLLVATILVLFLHVVLLIHRPDWVAVTPLGPTQNSRFWGIGNQLETLLLAPVMAGAAVAARRYGTIGFGLFAALSLVIVTDNRLGSDGGGALVFGVALAFVGSRARGASVRGFIGLLLLSLAGGLAIIEYNLHAPAPDHLRSALSHGMSGVIAVVRDRLPLSYTPALHHWMLLTPIALVFACAYVLALRFSTRFTRDLVVGAGLGLATSLLVNDSAVYELAGGTAVVAALARFTTAGPQREVIPPLNEAPLARRSERS